MSRRGWIGGSEPWRRRPLVPVAASFVLGCLGAPAVSPAGLALAAAGLAAAAAARALRAGPPAFVYLAASAALCGAHLSRPAPPSALELVLPALTDRPVRVTGRPTGLVRTTRGAGGTGVAVRLQLERVDTGRLVVPMEGQVLLLADAAARPVLARAGRLEAWVRLRRPREPANFGVLRRPGRGLVLARSTARELIEPREGRRALVDRWRERVARGLRHAGRERPLGAGLARALALGERDELDAELQARLREGGTAHVLAVSGLHCALVTWAVGLLVGRLGGRVRTRALLTLLTAWGFAALAGFGVPVLRAATLVSVFSAARWAGRGLDRWNGLAAAVLVAGLLRPEDVLGVGWCLTFGATAGLMALTAPLARSLGRPRRLATAILRDAGAASAAAWLTLLPIQLRVFGGANVLAPLWNLLAVPAAGVATALALAGAALGAALPAAAAPAVALVDRLGTGLGALDASRFLLPAGLVGAPTALAWWAALGVLLGGRDPRLRAGALVLGLACGLRLFAGAASGPPEGVDAVLTCLDVGQGSSTLVEVRGSGGDWTRWLVDGGGRPGSGARVGERVVVPALRARGLRRLDGAALSHADQDHLGGLPAVLRSLRPSRLVAAPVPASDREALHGLLAAGEAAGARVGLVARGDVLAPGLSVTWPARAPRAREGLSANDQSLVVAVGKEGDFALLPGDVEAAGERGLDARPAAVLVVPHHGSRTSTGPALLARLRPRVAIVSAGHANRFGHPHPEVLRRLAAAGVRTWCTATDGAVRVERRGRLLHVFTARGGGGVLALDGPRAACQDAPP